MTPQPPNIVLIEADRSVRLLTRMTLEDDGFVVVEATSGADALAHIATSGNSVRGIVCDIALPDLPIGLFLRIVHDRWNGRIPVVLSTGAELAQLRRVMELQGVSQVVRRPFDPETLARAVRYAVLDAPPTADQAVREPAGLAGLAQ